MIDLLASIQTRRAQVLLAASLLAGCQMLNPAFDGDLDELGDTVADDERETGDGDPSTGDGDGDPSTGDGDGDPSTGDGDGDPSTGDGDGDPSTGDGDGEQPCEEGLEDCNGMCVDLQFEPKHCGGCGNLCEDGDVCGQGQCLPKRYVFVSTTVFQGSFGGIPEAQDKCTSHAFEGQLPGEYRPWLSDLQQSPAQYANVEPAAYVLPNGTVVAWSWTDLIDDGQLVAPINRDQYGNPIEPSPACGLEYAVWTGTGDNGHFSAPNCQNWTVIAENSFGRVGNAQTAGPGWSGSDCLAPCSSKLPVYCVQQ